MYKIGIIQFPGTNCENETKRAIVNAGLKAEVIRWNDLDTAKNMDGYVIPGGNSYGNYSRAGIIAAQQPITRFLVEQAAAGKPIIGIANGCQILLEVGLIPGLEKQALAGAMSRSVRVKESEVLGTGFYHNQVYIKNVASSNRCIANMNIATNTVLPASIASDQSRLILANDLLLELEQHNQIIFKYCTSEGETLNEFPTTPDGSIWGVAGLCNKAGNVLGYMPHLERADQDFLIFESLKTYLENPPTVEDYQLQWQPPASVVETYKPEGTCTQFFIEPLANDFVAMAVEQLLQAQGFNVKVTRKQHWEVWLAGEDANVESITKALVETGELFNINKEKYSLEKNNNETVVSLLVRDTDDYDGKAITNKIKDRFNLHNIDNIRSGTVWELHFNETDKAKRLELASQILQTYILYNPYSQECKLIK